MKIHFDIDCDPDTLSSILALISPFLEENGEGFQYSALPQALMNLGEILERNRDGLGGHTWNGESWELVDSFIFSMANYRRRATFNRIEWAENFLDQLAHLEKEETPEADRAIFHVVRVMVKEMEQGRVGSERSYVYTDHGIPLSFSEWVSHLLSGKVTKTEIAWAHWNMIDPERLLLILQQWQAEQVFKNEQAEGDIPF